MFTQLPLVTRADSSRVEAFHRGASESAEGCGHDCWRQELQRRQGTSVRSVRTVRISMRMYALGVHWQASLVWFRTRLPVIVALFVLPAGANDESVVRERARRRHLGWSPRASQWHATRERRARRVRTRRRQVHRHGVDVAR